MTAYNIAAIPTKYRGRLYRSRLEAKWAAFFTLVGWDFEYEPFDFGDWSPDFLLRFESRQFLVEVKPITAFDQQVAWKVGLSCARQDCEAMDGLLLLGVSPFVSGHRVQMGWFLHAPLMLAPRFWKDLTLGRPLDQIPGRPVIEAFFENTGSVRHRISPAWGGLFSKRDGSVFREPARCVDECLALWAEATNAVQWQPRRARA